MINHHFSLFFLWQFDPDIRKIFLLKWDIILLLDISILCFRGKSKKDFESDSRKKNVQPVLLPNALIHISPIFLMEWLEIKVVCFNFGQGRAY